MMCIQARKLFHVRLPQWIPLRWLLSSDDPSVTHHVGWMWRSLYNSHAAKCIQVFVCYSCTQDGSSITLTLAWPVQVSQPFLTLEFQAQ